MKYSWTCRLCGNTTTRETDDPYEAKLYKSLATTDTVCMGCREHRDPYGHPKVVCEVCLGEIAVYIHNPDTRETFSLCEQCYELFKEKERALACRQ